MKHKIDKDLIFGQVWLGLMIFIIIAAIAFGIFRAWVFFNYGDTPVTELPAWVWWLMQSGGGK